MINKYYKKNSKQKILIQILNFLLVGFKFCVIGDVKKFGTKKIKSFLETRGHFYFESATKASIFLVTKNSMLGKINIPRVILLFKNNNQNQNIKNFKYLGLPVIEVNSNLFFLDFLYLLNKSFPN